MAHLPVVTDAEAENAPEVAALFAGANMLLGRLSNAVRTGAHSPRLMQPLFGFMIAALREEVSGVLDKRTKTLVILKTSMLNGCAYCIGHNTILGRALGFGDDTIAALEGEGWRESALFNAAEKAAIDWAHHLTERTYRQNRGAMDALKRHYNEAQIVEITMVCGYFNFWNRFTDGLEIDIEPREVNDLFRKSTKIDVGQYVDFMRSCWWTDEATVAAATRDAAE